MCERTFLAFEKASGKPMMDRKDFETSLAFVFNKETQSCLKAPFLLLKNAEIMYFLFFFQNLLILDFH